MSVFNRPGGGEEDKGGGQERGGKSWAKILGSSLPTSLNKNILEVVLEKDKRGAFSVSEEDCARLMKKIGLDQRPGVHLECVQICPNGRGVILITLKDNIQIEQFCRYDVIVVNESGIRATMIKPAFKKEVIITIRGIHPNTRDSTVLDYLSKFGKIATTKVVHGTYTQGPLKGIKNGNRSFKMEVRAGVNIGSYHFIDGQKISLRYPGQQQTCGRCHEISSRCIGKGIARNCEAGGGPKLEFSDYILALWKKIGYSPAANTEIVEEESEMIEFNDQEVNSFTPVKFQTCDETKYAGVCIKQIPRNTDQGLVMEFLCQSGLPEEKKSGVRFKANGSVDIDDLDSATCKVLIEAIHGRSKFESKLYCNGVVPLTPQKALENSENPPAPVKPSPTTTVCSSAPSVPPPGPAAPLGLPPDSTSPRTSSLVCPDTEPQASAVMTAIQTFEDFEHNEKNIDHETSGSVNFIHPCDTGRVVRRHSISIIDRTPPRDSLAAELLDTVHPRADLLRTKSALNDLKVLTDQLSEFGSCISSDVTSSGEDSVDAEEKSESDGFKTMNERKRNKKKKRKFKLTPGKETFLKKPNLVLSD